MSKEKRSRSWIPAAIVMVVAICIVVAILMRNQGLQGELTALREDLSASQAEWQRISAEKEALQSELASVEEAIREANLTYEESTAKIADLTVQIADLEVQNTSLENQIDVASQTEETYLRQAGEIAAVTEHMEGTGNSLRDTLSADTTFTGDLWGALFDAHGDLLSSLLEKRTELEEALALAKARLDAFPESGMEKEADALRLEIQEREAEISTLAAQIRMYGNPEPDED
ncbi:MAG: hypothetical protein IJ865_04305 [Clostridia bacterium]|nr:hypothetical protein [Clostridia bacterium]